MITFDTYHVRYSSLFTQFDLSRKVLASFLDTPEAIKHHIDKESKTLKETMQVKVQKTSEAFENSWSGEEIQNAVKGFLSAREKELPYKIEEVENRLKQNQVIMLVSLYEIYMKDIHREILQQKPTLLKGDRKIPLGRVILDLKEVIYEEIEREVSSLDRKSVEERANYFKEKLSISWQSEEIITLLKNVLSLRNSILHEDPDRKITEKDIADTLAVSFFIPFVTVIQAAVLYPKGFKMPQGFDSSFAKEFLKS